MGMSELIDSRWNQGALPGREVIFQPVTAAAMARGDGRSRCRGIDYRGISLPICAIASTRAASARN